MTLKTTFQSIFQIITNHVNSLLYYHDPISSKKGQKEVIQNGSKWNTAFLFPFVWQIISLLYGTCLMVYSETGQLNVQVLKNCSVVMYHQVFPPSIWPQGDFVWAVVVSISTSLFATALRNPCTLDRYHAVHNRKNGSILISIHGKGEFQ